MPHIEIDLDFSSHPKVIVQDPLGQLLFTRAIKYSAKHLTDGFIPSSALALLTYDYLKYMALLAQSEPAPLERLVAELCTPMRPGVAPLWEVVPGGWMIHDYLDWNLSKQQVDDIKRARSKASKKNGRLGGRPEKPRRNLDETYEKPNLNLVPRQGEPNTEPRSSTPDNLDETYKNPTVPISVSVSVSDSVSDSVPDTGTNKSKTARSQRDDDDFKEWLAAMPAGRGGRRIGVQKAREYYFRYIKPEERADALRAAKAYAKECRDSDRLPMDPFRFIYGKRGQLWREFVPPPDKPKVPKVAPPVVVPDAVPPPPEVVDRLQRHGFKIQGVTH